MTIKLPKYIKILLVVSLLFILFFIWGLHLNRKIYNSVFRLSEEEVTISLKEIPTQCQKISECELLPGDIIIRRYVTERTRDFVELLDPYYTHSALYIGNDELFEALGTDEVPENQVQISKFSESDWLNPDMNNFVIIRPKNYSGKLDSIILGLRNIANDPEYIFGPLKDGRKTVSCSDVILKYLENEEIVRDLRNSPEIITPDYLFWVTEKDKSNFEVVGYSL